MTRDFSTWPRRALDREARRLGIWAPSRLRREELVELIRSAERSPVRRAGRLLRRGVKFAVGLTPLAGLIESDAVQPGSDRTSTHPERPSKAECETPSAEPNGTTDAAPPSPVKVNVPERARPRPSARASKGDRGAGDRLAGDPLAGARLVDGEPLPTRTMARLLAEQGHHDRAQAIYWKLQKESPDDGSIAEEFEALAGRALSSASSESAGDEIVVARGEGEEEVVVAWTVADATLSDARAVCGGGTLVIRVVIVVMTGGTVERSTRDLIVNAGDDTKVVDVPTGARVAVALGYLDHERFFSVLHAPPYEMV